MASGPPSRAAPAPPSEEGVDSAGFQDAVAQLRAALARDPSGVGTDDATRSILEKLNDEMAKLYPGGEDDDEEDEDEYEDGDDEDEYDDEADVGEGEDPETARERRAVARQASAASKPRPVDLWRAAHETDRGAKETKVLSTGEWDGLVSRLNESSKKRQMFLLRAQHKQIADELSGLTFTPHISDKSRELAAHNKSLPERVAALMRKKKAKLDRIRHEQVEKELSEATFKPKLNKPKSAKIAEMQDNMKRHVKHLLEYEKHRRSRANMRRQLVQELEDRELTFTPAINNNSVRIVNRLNREREEQGRLAALGMAPPTEGSPGPQTSSARAAKRALAAALVGTAAAAAPLDARTLKTLGRSYLPGHEQETFHPRINPRSHALHRPGVDDKSVYSRLYETSTAARAGKLDSSRSPSALGATRGSGEGSSVDGREREPVDGQEQLLDEAGEPAPGHPHYFNVVAFEPGRMDFILRRVFPPTTLAAAAVSAAAGQMPFVTSQ